ncbi:hypothetical protein BIFADO_01237 [Bifidobacterium adolescentis L2-32]|uniref:Uncharacterized protein n=1 Tax=Bifidobacterium adolescentis L2-32 TaxID=411481 RepID=A7A5W0_BIFAD|nr:hypothetical protein BIFADO_01237 [Bifidobacterium adolescentis L2-32]
MGRKGSLGFLKKANLDVFGDCDDCHADHFEHTINPKLNQHVV